LAPLELNEVLYTLHQGVVTAGFILMLVVMVATLVVGRFFCSWGCHILALQDLAAYLFDRLGLARHRFRSRTLVWVPMLVMAYMFIWPQIASVIYGVPEHELRIAADERAEGWSSFTTDNLWRNLPPPEVAVATFLVCGFLIVYMMGSRGFCFHGCPYGALFGMADQLAPGRIKLTGSCTQCGLCTASCSSDILVHLEIKKHGKVTNPRCLKDLDCVAVCPEEAIHFGFTAPPLFTMGLFTGSYPDRYSTTWKEDISLMAVFSASVLILRGLYDLVPLLMAVGAAICISALALVAYRVVGGHRTQFRGVAMRADGGLNRQGRMLAALAAMVLVFMIHSAAVQMLTYRANGSFDRLRGASENGRRPSAVQVNNAIDQLESAIDIGLVASPDLRMRLANLRLIAGEEEKAKDILTGVIDDCPTHVSAAFHLAQIAARHRQEADAVRYLNLAAQGTDQPHSNDWRMRADAHYRLALYSINRQRLSAAEEHIKKALELNPDATSNMRHGAIEALKRTGVTDSTEVAMRLEELGL
jgi:ferredoxin/Flp pilus assembly protein TadD